MTKPVYIITALIKAEDDTVLLDTTIEVSKLHDAIDIKKLTASIGRAVRPPNKTKALAKIQALAAAAGIDLNNLPTPGEAPYLPDGVDGGTPEPQENLDAAEGHMSAIIERTPVVTPDDIEQNAEAVTITKAVRAPRAPKAIK